MKHHEYSTIPGIKEDVTDIILNLKGVRLKLNQDGPRIVNIDVSRDGIVTAADIITDGTVEILNPDHYIATLSGGKKFKAEHLAGLLCYVVGGLAALYSLSWRKRTSSCVFMLCSQFQLYPIF
jgi:hypothetical protein